MRDRVLDEETTKLLKKLTNFAIHNHDHQHIFAVEQYVESYHINYARTGPKTVRRNLSEFCPEALRFLDDVLALYV